MLSGLGLPPMPTLVIVEMVNNQDAWPPPTAVTKPPLFLVRWSSAYITGPTVFSGGWPGT
jgi:hypothetical protein